ncbi:MAG: TrpB-like pyridoxal phosphate-dependent enzyme [Thermoplasmata archaeon]
MATVLENGHSKVLLTVDDVPRRWYNIAADLPEPLPPPVNPATKEPIGPKALTPLFPGALIQQEVSADRYIDIPDEVREAYLRLGRPSPLYRAQRLEEALRTPAKIYYKREDLSPTGSHKPNTAIAQAYYSAQKGVEKLTTETGAGQWGSALSLACNYFDMACTVFMVRVSFEQKPYRKYMMEVMGSTIYPSPSAFTEFGKRVLKEAPDHPGSLGIAISEALEVAVQDEKTKYSLGSVLNHVLLHQTVVGQEAKLQMEALDLYPDAVVGSVGGGSNFSGLAYPFLGDVLRGDAESSFYAIEPAAVPSLTEGEYAYDFGDTAEMTPLLKMFTLGHTFVPPKIHAGGLRYHGAAPTLSLLVNGGQVQARAYDQLSTYEAGALFAKTEGLIPAPETNHAVKGAIDLALEAKERGEERTILFNFSGHGLLDMEGFAQYLHGGLEVA